MKLIDLDEAHEAASDGFNHLAHFDPTMGLRDPLIPVYTNLMLQASRKELYHPENMRFETPTTSQLTLDKFLNFVGIAKDMPFVNRYQPNPLS